jgi:hypothetical protein
MVCFLLSHCLVCRRLLRRPPPCIVPNIWSASCLMLHGPLIACRETLVCLISRLLQIAQAARSPGWSCTGIGAEKNRLHAAAGTLLRGCFLHKRQFA